jgi:hypothetical protein
MRPKYGNTKIKNAYGTFDSSLEWSRFLFLSNREKEGEITNLRRQVEYLLIPAQYGTEIKHLKTKDKEVRVLLERSCSYIADFVYERNGKTIVEDCKGSKYIITADFKIKKKLLLWVHGIELRYVFSATQWDK